MKKVFNPPSVRRPFGNYNHGLLVPPGASLLVTSGQLGIGLDDRIPADVTAQAEMCFEALKAILDEAVKEAVQLIRAGQWGKAEYKMVRAQLQVSRLIDAAEEIRELESLRYYEVAAPDVDDLPRTVVVEHTPRIRP